jgi:TRAP-type mannitol/chloroaromatic compound transport system permease large subunit
MKIDKKEIFERVFFLTYAILIFIILVQFIYWFDKFGLDKLNIYLRIILVVLFGYAFFSAFFKFGFFVMSKIEKKLFKEVDKNVDGAK